METDHEIISTAILPLPQNSRRVVDSYKQTNVQKVLVNPLVKLAQEKKCGHDMTIPVDWDVKHQTKPKQNQPVCNL